MPVRSRVSEIVLFCMLVLLLASMRIYWDTPEGLIWVWKGEPSFTDTVVDLKSLLALPRTELKNHHHDVMWQLEDMGFIEESQEHAQRRQKVRNRKELKSKASFEMTHNQ